MALWLHICLPDVFFDISNLNFKGAFKDKNYAFRPTAMFLNFLGLYTDLNWQVMINVFLFSLTTHRVSSCHMDAGDLSHAHRWSVTCMQVMLHACRWSVTCTQVICHMHAGDVTCMQVICHTHTGDLSHACRWSVTCTQVICHTHASVIIKILHHLIKFDLP